MSDFRLQPCPGTIAITTLLEFCSWLDISIEEVGTVCNRFFDYDDGDFAMSISDNMAMDSDGNLMLRMGDHMAMDMDTGDIHMISSWPDDDE